MKLNIEYVLDKDIDLYYVKVNGEILLECLALDEVKALTIGEILSLL